MPSGNWDNCLKLGTVPGDSGTVGAYACKRAHTHGGTNILSPSQVLDQTGGERNASSVSFSSALKVARSPSHATTCTSNQHSDRSHSENIGGSVQAFFKLKLLKGLSHRTAHVGNHISHHPHSHSGGSQCGGSALYVESISQEKQLLFLLPQQECSF